MPLTPKREEEIWKDSLKRAVENKFDYLLWHRKCDPLGHQIITSQARMERISFDEMALKFISYTKMKAIAFSHEFAIAFFPKIICSDQECSICKAGGGHNNHIFHMQQMCTYENFTAYLEKILDEEE